MSYFVLGEGFGCEFQSQYLKWIYFAPGRKFDEGLLLWGDETLGVVPWIDGQPKHYFRNATQIIKELIDCGIVEILKSKVLSERPQKAWQDCPHIKSAELLGLSYLGSAPINIVNRYRHACTNYDSSLKSGADRRTAQLKAALDLVEIINFFELNKDELMQSQSPEWVKNLTHSNLCEIKSAAIKMAQ